MSTVTTFPEKLGRMVIMLYALGKRLHWVTGWRSSEEDHSCSERQNIWPCLESNHGLANSHLPLVTELLTSSL